MDFLLWRIDEAFLCGIGGGSRLHNGEFAWPGPWPGIHCGGAALVDLHLKVTSDINLEASLKEQKLVRPLFCYKY